MASGRNGRETGTICPDITDSQEQARGLDGLGPLLVIPLTARSAPLPVPQVIKLLGTDKGKKNKTNLIFLVGNRVLSYMDKCLATERALTSLLKNGPNEHVQGVDKLQKSVKLLHKVRRCRWDLGVD
uniref:Alanyl-tRNA editing protein Aarsd1-B-like n=1 Tax=Callorhinchus milii TaxID=7868 RepID=A0A4W3GF53_CALMI|eukprot:gi/632992059/ref/XP_007884904.1/ PREDICTED: alanyl-tRNA editing protein Aarsd1-B-like [Callorhinchus milii]